MDLCKIGNKLMLCGNKLVLTSGIYGTHCGLNSSLTWEIVNESGGTWTVSTGINLRFAHQADSNCGSNSGGAYAGRLEACVCIDSAWKVTVSDIVEHQAAPYDFVRVYAGGVQIAKIQAFGEGKGCEGYTLESDTSAVMPPGLYKLVVDVDSGDGNYHNATTAQINFVTL